MFLYARSRISRIDVRGSRYNPIRERFQTNDIKLFLNPSFRYLHDTAKFLLEVEALRNN